MMYRLKTSSPAQGAARPRLPGAPQAEPAEANAARELAGVAAAEGLWSSRRIRAAAVAQQAAKSRPR
jgi:hypothetical protein